MNNSTKNIIDIINFEGQDIVYILDLEDNNLWMNIKDIAKLYNRSVIITRHYLEKELLEKELLEDKNYKISNYELLGKLKFNSKDCEFFESNYNINSYSYSHEAVLSFGWQIDYEKTKSFEEFLNRRFGIKVKSNHLV